MEKSIQPQTYKAEGKMTEKMPEKGSRFNYGKIRLDLVPPEMIKGIAQVFQKGLDKYEERNWEKGLDYMGVYASGLRHALAWVDGEDLDKESGLPHVFHAAVNFLMIATYTQRGMNHLDDRPSKAVVAECAITQKEDVHEAVLTDITSDNDTWKVI